MSDFGYQVLGFGGGGGDSSNYSAVSVSSATALDIALSSSKSIDSYRLSSNEALIFESANDGGSILNADFAVYLATRTDTVWGAVNATRKVIFTNTPAYTMSRVMGEAYKVVILSDTKAFVLYGVGERPVANGSQDNTKIYGVILDIAGGVITVGTPVLIRTVTTEMVTGASHYEAIKLNSNSVMIGYPQTSTISRMAIATVSGSTFSIGTELNLTTETGYYFLLGLAAINDTTALLVMGNTAGLTARVCVISHTGGVINTPITVSDLGIIASTGLKSSSLIKCKTGKYIFSYADAGGGQTRGVVIISTSGVSYSSVSAEVLFRTYTGLALTRGSGNPVSSTQTLFVSIPGSASQSGYFDLIDNASAVPVFENESSASLGEVYSTATAIVQLSKNKYSFIYAAGATVYYRTITLS